MESPPLQSAKDQLIERVSRAETQLSNLLEIEKRQNSLLSAELREKDVLFREMKREMRELTEKFGLTHSQSSNNLIDQLQIVITKLQKVLEEKGVLIVSIGLIVLSVFPQSILLPIIRARSSSWKIAYNGKRRVSNRQWSYYRGTQLVLYSLALHQRETNDTVFPFRHKTRCQVMQQQLEKAQEERERFMVSELQVMVCSIE